MILKYSTDSENVLTHSDDPKFRFFNENKLATYSTYTHDPNYVITESSPSAGAQAVTNPFWLSTSTLDNEVTITTNSLIDFAPRMQFLDTLKVDACSSFELNLEAFCVSSGENL